MLVYRKAPSTVGWNGDFDVGRIGDFECDRGIVKLKDILRASVGTLSHLGLISDMVFRC